MKRLLLALVLLAGVDASAQPFIRFYPPNGPATFNGSLTVTGATSQLLLPDGTSAAPSLVFISATTTGLFNVGGNSVGIRPGLRIYDATPAERAFIGAIANAAVLRLDGDTYLYRDAANTLGLRNSTNNQIFNIYGTYTDSSNYERILVGYSANVAYFLHQAAGTGAVRNMVIGSSGSLGISVGGSTRWFFDGTSPYAFRPNIDDSFDFGMSNYRLKNIFASTSIQGSKVKALTEGSATPFVRIAVPVNEPMEVNIDLMVFCSDGTDSVVTTYKYKTFCVNKAGTESCNSVADTALTSQNTGSGTISPFVNAVDTTPANAVDFTLNVTCSLTQSVLDLYYRLDLLKPQTITPQ